MDRFALAAALAFLASAASAETLTNKSVVDLVGMNLGDEAVIAKIRTSDARFDLSTEQMIALKNAGVSGPVIAAMLQASAPKAAALSIDSPDPMTPHPSGLYLLASDGGRMVRIDSTTTNQAKTGGILGYALTSGIASASVKAAIQNETARVKTPIPTPVFYFFFDESNPETATRATAWAAGSASTINSPGEFTLIRLMKKDGRREARVGSMNIAGAKTGVMDKDRIAFNYDMVRPGVFKATPATPLQAGEYGFIYSIEGKGAGGALTAKIFDFSVEANGQRRLASAAR